MSDDRTSLKDVVENYLRKYPDFLVENPELLETLEIHHSSGAAVSLIEKQVEQLRAANDDLNQQLSYLIRVATENEQLMARLHRLTLDLMAIEPRCEFFTHLGGALLNDFNTDILQICLFDPELAEDAGEDVMSIAADDPRIEPFRALLEKDETFCGRLGEERMDFLFGSKARWVQSMALMPLGKNGKYGLMAIGSSDQNRFFPGMGTLFLDLLTDVISTNLSKAQPQEQRRTA